MQVFSEIIWHSKDLLELAEKYADRIISLKDGKIIGDTNPYKAPEEIKADKKEKKKRKYNKRH